MRTVKVELACGEVLELAPVHYRLGWEMQRAVMNRKEDQDAYDKKVVEVIAASLQRAGRSNEEIVELHQLICISDIDAVLYAAVYGRNVPEPKKADATD